MEAGAAGQNVARHLELTEKAAAEGARLVVWPESAVPFYYDHTPALAELLRERVRRLGIYLFFGNDDRELATTGEDRVYVGAKMCLRRASSAALPQDAARALRRVRPMQKVLTLGGRVTAKVVEQVADFTPAARRSWAR